jgi:hypothetical protein
LKRPAVWLAAFLLLVPAFLIGYRVLFLGYPLIPTSSVKAWQLSMGVDIQPREREVMAMIGLPSSQGGRLVTEERINSGSLNFNLLREGSNQIGVWSGGAGENDVNIGYQAIILDRQEGSAENPSLLPVEPSGGVDPSGQILAKRLVAPWIQLPPAERLRTILATFQGTWGNPPPGKEDVKALAEFRQEHGPVDAWILLLRAADLSVRPVEGLHLAESMVSKLMPWVEVWTGQGWERFNPENGALYPGSISLLPLMTGGLPAVHISHGELRDIRWILTREIVSQWRFHFERITRSDHFLNRWSLFRLPEEFQGIFRILILVPIGALLTCLLRNVVGFPTFGIFMPVLMALAFRTTGLVYGLGIFAAVVLLGYLVRTWIDKLRLLLVPRLSILLTLVVAAFIAFALVGNKLGMRQFMAVGLLPFVILTMTIERFYVIVEEAGAREALWTAAGSAAVATITYEIIHFEPLQLTFFVYPELLFVVAAIEILLGRYTGYRLFELIRFRVFRGPR